MICFIGDVSMLMQFLQEEDAETKNGVWVLQGHMVFRGGQVSIDSSAVYFPSGANGEAVLLCPALIRRVYGIQYVP